MNEIKVGDRVEMRTEESSTYNPVPDLGHGTVISTTDESLMVGLYVLVEWDKFWGHRAERPSIQSLRKIEESKS